MDVTALNTPDIFSYTIQQQDQLDNLANRALSSGIDLYIKKNYEGAIKEFKRAMSLSPNSSYATDASNYMAQAYLQLDDTQGAIDAYKRSLKLDPGRTDTHLSLGNLYFYENRYQEAQQEYEQAVRLDPSSANRFSLGQAYMYNGRYSEAEAQFQQVQSLEPNKPGGYYGLGQNYAKQGLYSHAISAFEKALEVSPDFYDAYAEMGYAYADLGQMEEAREILHQLQDKAPSLAGSLSSYIYQVSPPKIWFSNPLESSFPSYLSAGTQLSALDAYLANAGASKTFTMVFQFSKEMDRASVENPLNWKIGRAMGPGLGEIYNFGLPVPSTEVSLHPYPLSVYYDATAWSATIQFKIQQNASANGTIDPTHIQFTFAGEDVYGVAMDPEADQYTGFSGVA